MSSAASNLVSKVWNYCNLLRDDGVSYGDYVEQLTYLLFLKMDYERTRPPYNKKSTIPEDYNWASLIEMDGLCPLLPRLCTQPTLRRVCNGDGMPAADPQSLLIFS